jgi:hypothetical protein
VHDPAPGGIRVREIRKDQKICIKAPYNIQVVPKCARPLLIHPDEKVQLRYKFRALRTLSDSSEPIVLCGIADQDGVGLSCPEVQLTNGMHYLNSTTAGTIKFIQDCKP